MSVSKTGAIAALAISITLCHIACAQNISSKFAARSSASDPDVYQRYAAMLQKTCNEDLTREAFGQIRMSYFAILMPDMNKTHEEVASTNPRYSYPLAFLKSKAFYHAAIEKLLRSQSLYNRVLAYMTVASADDSSFNAELWKATTNETDHNGIESSGSALLYLKDPHTSQLFDFLVKHENFGDAHMLPMMLNQPKSRLRDTCYQKIKSPDLKTKVLAVQLLSSTDLNPRTDQAVREAYHDLNGTTKGFAISAMQTLRMGNLKDLLAPELANKHLRRIIMAALVNSPTPDDQAYADSLLPASGELPADILGAYMSSDNPEMVRKFLILVRDRPVPAKFEYQLLINKNPLLSSPLLREQLKDTLEHTRNKQIVPFLGPSKDTANAASAMMSRVPQSAYTPRTSVSMPSLSPEEMQKFADWQVHFNKSNEAYKAKRYDEAAHEGEQAVKIAESFKNPEFRLYITIHNLVSIYQDQKRWADAERLLRRSLETFKGDKGRVDETYKSLFILYMMQGKTEQANAVRKEQEAKTGKQLTGTDKYMFAENAAGNLINQRKYAEAEPYLRTVIEYEKQNMGNGRSSPAFTMARLAQVYTFEGKYKEAEPLFKEAIAEAQLHRSPAKAELSMIYKMYAQMLEKMNRKKETAEALQKVKEAMKPAAH